MIDICSAIGGTIPQAWPSVLGSLNSAISAEYHESLDAEKTLTFETVLDSTIASMISINTTFRYNGQYYDIVTYDKKLTEDNMFLINVSAEHISYRLANIAYISSRYRSRGGEIAYWVLNERVVGPNGFVGRVTSITAYNAPEIETLERGFGYSKDSTLTVTGQISGATARLKVTLVDKNGGIHGFERIKKSDTVKWSQGVTYSQQWTSGNGGGYSAVVYSVDEDGQNPKFMTVGRGSGYKKGDQIIIGRYSDDDNPENDGPLASLSVAWTGWGYIVFNLLSIDLSHWQPTAVGGISNVSPGASMPDEETGLIEDEDSNFNKTGTLIQILTEILNGTSVGISGAFDTNKSFTFQSSSTNVREILIEFINWMHDEELTTCDIIFNNWGVNIITQNLSLPKFLINDQNVKIMSHTLDKHTKTKTQDYKISYSCDVAIIPNNLSLGDAVKFTQNELQINTTLRVIAINYNPFDELECSIEVSNILKVTNFYNTVSDLIGRIIDKKKKGGAVTNKNEEQSSDDSGEYKEPDTEPSGTGGGGSWLIMDHIPTQDELDQIEAGTLIFVYNPSSIVEPTSGSTP